MNASTTLKPQPRKFPTVTSSVLCSVPLIEWLQEAFTVRISFNSRPKTKRPHKRTNITTTNQTNQPDLGR